MPERDVTRQKLPPSRYSSEGNTITLHAAEYKPEVITDSSRAVIFIPGWSMRGDARAVKHLGRAFARENHSVCLTLSSTFRKNTPLSLTQQVTAMQQTIAQRGYKKVLLVGYSEGAAKTLKLAATLEQKPEKPQGVEVEAAVLLSPLGLAQHQHARLAADLAKAAFFHIPLQSITEIIHHKEYWKQFFPAAQAGLAIFRTMARRALQRGPVAYIHMIQQELTNMATPIPEVRGLKAPILIVLGEKDTVIPMKGAIEEVKTTLPNAKIITMEKFGNHGMPFLTYREVAKAVTKELQPTRS